MYEARLSHHISATDGDADLQGLYPTLSLQVYPILPRTNFQYCTKNTVHNLHAYLYWRTLFRRRSEFKGIFNQRNQQQWRHVIVLMA